MRDKEKGRKGRREGGRGMEGEGGRERGRGREGEGGRERERERERETGNNYMIVTYMCGVHWIWTLSKLYYIIAEPLNKGLTCFVLKLYRE